MWNWRSLIKFDRSGTEETTPFELGQARAAGALPPMQQGEFTIAPLGNAFHAPDDHPNRFVI